VNEEPEWADPYTEEIIVRWLDRHPERIITEPDGSKWVYFKPGEFERIIHRRGKPEEGE
jgi:hypothetical protein